MYASTSEKAEGGPRGEPTRPRLPQGRAIRFFESLGEINCLGLRPTEPIRIYLGREQQRVLGAWKPRHGWISLETDGAETLKTDRPRAGL